jgi:Binding domain of DNA repair protein Ercc1 (rad10/Swi10)
MALTVLSNTHIITHHTVDVSRPLRATVRRLRLLLCLVDTEDNVKLLLELNKLAVVKGFTLLLAWTWQEAARYLETFKAYENKPPTSIQEKVSIMHDQSLAVLSLLMLRILTSTSLNLILAVPI